MESLAHINEETEKIKTPPIRRNTFLFNFSGTNTIFRRNSPKTIQACVELGISLDDLQIKQKKKKNELNRKKNNYFRDIDDFGTNMESYEIKKLRYDHHNQQIHSEIYLKKKKNHFSKVY